MTSSSLHVAIVCPGLGQEGSVADVALHHAQELSKRFCVTLFSDSFPPHARPSGAKRVLVQAPRFRWLHRFAHVPAELGFVLAARRALFRCHTRTPVDVLVCHGHVTAYLAGRPFTTARGAPHILVTHGDISARPKGTYDTRLTWLYNRFTPLAYRSADLIVALSPPMRELAIRGGAPVGRVVLVPNGIDPYDIGLSMSATRAPASPSPSPPCILYVGRLSPEKGIDTLLEAATLLRRRDFDFRLHVYGDGFLARRCFAARGSGQLDGHVVFHGRVPRKRLGDVYMQADVVCVPSRSDTHPAVVLEAMICGVPVVGCSCGGIPFLLGELAAQLLVAPGDAAALADRLLLFLADPQRCREVGRQLRARAQSEFDWQKTGAALSNEILALAANRRSVP